MTVTRYESLFQKYWSRGDSAKKTQKNDGNQRKMFKFFSKTLKNNENFSVQRLHHYWKVLAGRVGKDTVENDFCQSQCNENNPAIKI